MGLVSALGVVMAGRNGTLLDHLQGDDSEQDAAKAEKGRK